MKKPASYEAGYLRILSTPKFGGDKRDRTADLLNAIQALSQLERLHTPAKRAKERFNTRELLSLIPANK